MNAQHLSNSAEWATPLELVESARAVLGEIDLDPATTQAINAKHVRARSWMGAEHDSLSRSWSGRVFVNPPGGCPIVLVEHVKRRTVCGNEATGDRNPPCSCRLVSRFWSHLIEHHVRGTVPAAIWIGFSLEQLSSLQKFDSSPMDYPLCIVGPSRVRYLDADNDLQPAGSPTHASFVSYMGPKPSAFRAEFSKHGACK